MSKRWLSVGATALASFGLAVFATAADARPGELERSYGRDGVATISVSGDGAAETILAGRGRTLIVAASEVSAGQYETRAVLTRLDPQGQLVSPFGDRGRVLVPATGQFALPVALLPADLGRFVVVVGSTGQAPEGETESVEVFRYSSAGEIDEGYGAGGRAEVAGYVAKTAALDNSGRLLVAAEHYANFRFYGVLLRFTAEGQLDTSFGGDGIVDLAPQLRPRALSLAKDGRITVGAWREGLDGDDPGAVVAMRLLPDGEVDTTFKEFSVTRPDQEVPSINLVPLAGGRTYVSAGLFGERQTLAYRLHSDGTLDRSYSRDGKLALSSFVALSAALDAGRLLVAGLRVDVDPGVTLQRFTGGGSPDRSFGPARARRQDRGIATSPVHAREGDFLPGSSLPLLVRADESIFVAGATAQRAGPDGADIAVARHEGGRLTPVRLVRRSVRLSGHPLRLSLTLRNRDRQASQRVHWTATVRAPKRAIFTQRGHSRISAAARRTLTLTIPPRYRERLRASKRLSVSLGLTSQDSKTAPKTDRWTVVLR